MMEAIYMMLYIEGYIYDAIQMISLRFEMIQIMFINNFETFNIII